MITLDENEKRASQPPAYSHIDGTLYPPPPVPQQQQQQQQQLPGAPANVPAYPSPTLSPASSSRGYPASPGSAAPMMPTSPPMASPQPQISRAQMEAQMGSQYQQQLFARCARGDHEVTKKYGPCGIISSVILFPFGLLFLLVDVEKKCARCGIPLP